MKKLKAPWRRKPALERTLNNFDQHQLGTALNRLVDMGNDIVFTEDENTALTIAVCCVAQVMNRMMDGQPIHWDGQQ